ncbi:MAG TPA: energy transducer TonB [Luteimonas sp.]|nr:energy transducer TonB [Luteimonas sp.]
MLFVNHEARPALIRIGAIVLVSLAFAGCKKEQAGETAAEAGTEATQAAATEQKPAVADKVTTMTPEQLRDAAGQALRQQRLYAPEGDNAMEYYLALRDKQPNDPAVSSALTDLLPYALIATEQSINRNDFDEAQRLYALLEKADGKHPALARLQKSITDGRAAAAERAKQEQLAAEEEIRRQAELEKQRIAEQQQAQKEAAEAFARQQEAERQAAAQREAAQSAPARTQPAAPSQQASSPATQPAAPPPQRPVANTTLRPISLPAPEYPREAQRRRRAGEVEVEFTVGTDGTVTSARVVNASPPRVFDRAALSAVNRWRFQPVSSPVTSRRKIEFKPAN